MLQALAHESGATGCCTHEEATCACIGCLPNEIANALKPKHGIEGEEGNHGNTTCGVASTCSNEARHCTSFSDAFFENLALSRFCVGQQQVVVNWFVLLAVCCVNLLFAEQRVHAKCAGFVGNDGHNALTEVVITREIAQHASKRHRGAHCLFARARSELLEHLR